MADRSSDILDYRNTNGHGWSFYECDGVLRLLAGDKTPEKDMEVIRNVTNFRLRDDDVMIVAYPKCGTHWLWEIVTMIRSGRAEYSTYQKEIAMLGMPMYEKAESLPSPRVLNSHNFFRHLPKTLTEKKIKTIHIMRNPKDVSVSFFNHEIAMKAPLGFEGTYAEWANLFLEGTVPWGSFFQYIKDWQKVKKDNPDLPILNLYFEDLKQDPMKTIYVVADFLGEVISDGLCKEIADACSFTRLKMADLELKEDCANGSWSTLWKQDYTKIYRKGVVGDWKKWLTVAQNEVFDDVIKREMKETEITFSYE